MNLQLSFYGSLCATSEFKINGIDADSDDFGDHYDASPETAEDYGCGDKVFEPKEPTPETLAKYGINGPEYELVANALRDGLSFGNCGWCV